MRVIREFEHRDFADVLQSIGTFSLEHMKMAAEELSSHWGINGARYFVCEIDGKVVGHLGYTPDLRGAKDIYWAEWGYVHKDYRNIGVATDLWEYLESDIKNRGGRKIYFDVGNADEHADAIRLYEKRGYIKEGELLDYWGEGDHFLVYARKL
ncbi:MAG: GNAT family N-acetyltransferase [Lutisporaceae bacterium]